MVKVVFRPAKSRCGGDEEDAILRCKIPRLRRFAESSGGLEEL